MLQWAMDSRRRIDSDLRREAGTTKGPKSLISPNRVRDGRQVRIFMNIRITSFEKSERDIRIVRDTVFGQEQQVPRELDWDGKDPDCIHAVATDDADHPIGTGRIQGDGRIGRLAVLAAWRGRGVGRRMLEQLVESARARALEQVYLHAQIHTVLFYKKGGFEADGGEFTEASIRHIRMTKNTQPMPE